MARRMHDQLPRTDASLALKKSVDKDAHDAPSHQPPPAVEVTAQLGTIFGNQLIQFCTGQSSTCWPYLDVASMLQRPQLPRLETIEN